jgi:transcriptional regulator with XRE-family HTH domain
MQLLPDFHAQRLPLLWRMLGIGQAQLSKYELGQSAPTAEILLRLKTYSRKSVDWILTGDEPQTE